MQMHQNTIITCVSNFEVEQHVRRSPDRAPYGAHARVRITSVSKFLAKWPRKEKKVNSLEKKRNRKTNIYTLQIFLILERWDVKMEM